MSAGIDLPEPLDPAQGVKPLDFGGHGVTGSVDEYGRLIALNTFHPVHGYVTLTVAPPFPEAERYNPAAVRAYRASLAALEGFGPLISKPVRMREAYLLEGAIPYVRLTLEDGSTVESTTFAWGGGAIQIWRGDVKPLCFVGTLSMQRCAYTQLTEGGPVAMPPVRTHAELFDGVLTLENPALYTTVAIAGFAQDLVWQAEQDGPLTLDLPLATDAPGLVFTFGSDPLFTREDMLSMAQVDVDLALRRERRDWVARRPPDARDPVVWRGLVYGEMLAVPVGEPLCILTDHMLLPLSWNRDAYYVARALLSWGDPIAVDVVRRHLLWMFETADRPGGAWGRCYLANGRVKDPAYQLDQQVFPLIELAEYVAETGDGATWERLREHVPAVLRALLARRDSAAGLFPTDETPADDPLAFPFHFSSHILIWRAVKLLNGLDDSLDYEALADEIRERALVAFAAQRDGVPLFAYATDGAGQVHFYHDANDVPLALAPAWGFVEADDPVWHATVDFAFSPANVGGYYAGRLGSVHTRAAWPLGDAQDIIVARVLNDADRERRAWDRLHAAAQWDGALPEAVDPATNAVASRPWFAWPNALAAWLALDESG